MSGHIDNAGKVNSKGSSRGKRPVALGRMVLWACGILLALLVTFSVVLYIQVMGVRSDMKDAIHVSEQLGSELGNKDQAQVESLVAQLIETTAGIRNTTSSPSWRAASHLPVIGQNFAAVHEVSVSADDLLTKAIGPLLQEYFDSDMGDFIDGEGRINLQKIQAIEPTVSSASHALDISYRRLDAIDETELLPQVKEPLRGAVSTLGELNLSLKSAASAARLAPPMLGAVEPRTYLLLIQNNAEARATGGIPGALALIHADGGEFTLGEQSSAVALGTFDPEIPVSETQTEIYSSRLGRQMQNVNLTPDFPTAAATAKEMWERKNGTMVDGVLALDPVVLASLLRVSGPVELTDTHLLSLIRGTSLPTSLTSQNVVSSLMSTVYQEISDPVVQDLYFAAVAGSLFDALTETKMDITPLLSSLSKGVEEQRLYLWSADESEQATIDQTDLSGSISGPSSSGASFGVFFNDGTGAKMDYYAERSVTLTRTCTTSEYSDYVVRVTVTNTAPADASESLPTYVTGDGHFGVSPGHIRTNYVFYGPPQSLITSTSVDGIKASMGSSRHGGRPVGTVTVELAPGETSEIEASFSRIIQGSEAKVRLTPGIQPINEVLNLPQIDSSCDAER